MRVVTASAAKLVSKSQLLLAFALAVSLSDLYFESSIYNACL